jgi:hypothetical protein
MSNSKCIPFHSQHFRKNKSVKMLKLFLLLIAFAVGLTKQEEDIVNFEVCPESHPFAFQFGQKCCSFGSFENMSWSSDTCEGEAINCLASSCEDRKSTCNPTVGVFYLNVTDIYEMVEYLEENRPIYIDGYNETCIWWIRANRHWWWGPCENVGTNSGNAYLPEDNSCPDYPERTWRRSGSNELYNDLDIFVGNKKGCSAFGHKVETISGTVGVNVIVIEGTYKQSCRFKFQNGKYKCVKE